MGGHQLPLFLFKGIRSKLNLRVCMPVCHALMWGLDHKEGWAPKNWCFQIMVLDKTLESPLDSKENKPVNPKGNQPWIFIERTEEKLHYFGHLTQRGDLMEKTLMLGKTEGRKRRVWQGMRWLVSIIESMDINLNKLLETVKNGEPCSPQGHKELDTT